MIDIQVIRQTTAHTSTVFNDRLYLNVFKQRQLLTLENSMKFTTNIAIPTTMFLSVLLLTACASNSEPDAATRSTSTETVQPDNNFGRNVVNETTNAPKTKPEASTQPAAVKTTTKNKAQKTKKAKKKVTKKADPAAAVVSPANN